MILVLLFYSIALRFRNVLALSTENFEHLLRFIADPGATSPRGIESIE